MSQVMMPQRGKSKSEDLLTVGGAIIGGISGGPQGAMMGAQAGGMAGNMLSGNNQPPPQSVASQGPAMQRRMENTQQDPTADLKAADQALAAMTPEMQKQYRPAIQEAMMRAEASRGMA